MARDPDEYYAEASNDEIFSGPTHDLIPSSYSSFHQHSHHGRMRRDSMQSSLSHTESVHSLSSDRQGSYRPRHDSFSFFSPTEIENAEGASTVYGDDDDGSIEVFSRTSSPEAEERVHQTYYDDDDSQVEEPLLDENMDEFVYRAVRHVQRYYISEEDMRIVCAGYKRSRVRRFCYIALCICTLGIAYLILRWFPRWRIAFIASRCPLGNCDLMMVENQWGELEALDVTSLRYNHALSTIFNTLNPEINPPVIDDDAPYVDRDPKVPYLRTVDYRYIKFIYNPVTDLFMTNSDWAASTWEHHDTAIEGLNSDVQAQREMVFGRNILDIRQPSVRKLLIDEVLHPFYIFQVFSIILWAFDDYLYYATAIFVVSIASVSEALVATRKTLARLSEIAHQDVEMRVLRSGFWTTINSSDLVPGDVYELSDPNLSLLPCDSVLLSGDCIVNESILTGESVPVSKIPADDEALQRLVQSGPGVISKNFLYCGTRIIRVRKPAVSHQGDEFEAALAMAARTGFQTTKGALLRSMMFPKPSGFKFYRDSFRYIGVMGLIAMVGFLVSAINFIKMGLSPYLIVVRALDLITIVVPPALPATLTIGTNISLSRLRQKSIFCITPSRVNVGGRIDIVCFDKTGTLTEDGLDVLGVRIFDGKFGELVEDASELPSDSIIVETLATCHELRSVDGELIGDPLDIKMFEFSKWKFTEDEHHRQSTNPDGSVTLHVAKQFDFVSQLRRASVVVSGRRGTAVLVKGAPEVMRTICSPQSLPPDYDEVLHEYTHRGYRVIAFAYRLLDSFSDYSREELESNLTFAGFIVFENKLKETTTRIIEELDAARLRTVMCTGDNLLTAVCVGRECAIIKEGVSVYAPHFTDGPDGAIKWECVDDAKRVLDPVTLESYNGENYTLAITGDVFRCVLEEGNTEQIHQMLIRASIYARMSPDEKHELICRLQAIDYTTCFCGDGANDCGALKEADVGISLSEAEASVAAPFTSRVFDISCVPTVIREGRCALNTSFSCFKYMSMYSAIQFLSVSILYSYGSNIGDFQFLWIDLFLIVPLAVFMAWSEPSSKLGRKRPTAKLVSRKVLVPLIGMIVISAFFQVVAWKYGRRQPWYVAPVPGDNDNLKSTDNTALFESSSFQYIFVAWILCEGAPFRKPVYTNKPFLATIAVTLLFTLLFIFIDPETSVGRLMDMTWTSTKFKFVIIMLAVVNFLCYDLANKFVWSPCSDAISTLKRVLGYHKQRKLYKVLQSAATKEA